MRLFSYITQCMRCFCPIWMEDDIEDGDLWICEECRK